MRPAPIDAAAVVGGVAAGDEDDRRWILLLQDLLRDVEPDQVRELDVEEHDVRAERSNGVEAGGTVVRFARDVVAGALEERPGPRAEARVVVHDEDGPCHGRMLALQHIPDIGATPEMYLGAPPGVRGRATRR